MKGWRRTREALLDNPDGRTTARIKSQPDRPGRTDRIECNRHRAQMLAHARLQLSLTRAGPSSTAPAPMMFSEGSDIVVAVGPLSPLIHRSGGKRVTPKLAIEVARIVPVSPCPTAHFEKSQSRTGFRKALAVAIGCDASEMEARSACRRLCDGRYPHRQPIDSKLPVKPIEGIERSRKGALIDATRVRSVWLRNVGFVVTSILDTRLDAGRE